ncbi:hypothetical protein CDFC105_30786 [Clostridioides difficile]|nr:hypothetical protein CDFC105_30786 [Clostridioides difficile]
MERIKDEGEGVSRQEKGFFFQAEDGIRDAQESRGLGDVYKRQNLYQFELTENLLNQQ